MDKLNGSAALFFKKPGTFGLIKCCQNEVITVRMQRFSFLETIGIWRETARTAGKAAIYKVRLYAASKTTGRGGQLHKGCGMEPQGGQIEYREVLTLPLVSSIKNTGMMEPERSRAVSLFRAILATA